MALLLLADGSVWRGRAIGARGTTAGEICFNTGMTGYQEVFTDPSYSGQIVCTTHVHIGNYGVTAGEDAHLRLSGQFADDAGVLLGQGQRHIAGDGCQAQHRQVFRAAKGQQDRHGIILPRIGVDDDLSCHGCRPLPVEDAEKPKGGGLSMAGMGRGCAPAPRISRRS